MQPSARQQSLLDERPPAKNQGREIPMATSAIPRQQELHTTTPNDDAGLDGHGLHGVLQSHGIQPAGPALAGLPLGDSVTERFRAVRAQSLELARPLSVEDMMVQSCAEASPMKWHLAHTSWFFETFVLREYAPDYTPFDPNFLWLFNSYYKSLGEMPEKKLRASFSRPSLDAILAFRAHVDGAILDLLAGDCPEEAARRIVLGLHHEQQHQELSATDIKHALFTNPLHPAYVDPARKSPARAAPGNAADELTWTGFDGGLVEVGVTPDPDDVHAFAFDNETPRHTVYLQPYRLANRLVTCGEYLAFLNDNAYQRPELWLSEGWDTMRADEWQAPLYWARDAKATSGWAVYTMHGMCALDDLLQTPVCHLSLFEADAYARWAGHRLPTEFEWENAATHLVESGTVPETGNFLESGALQPMAVHVSTGGTHLQQIFGDVWEWTSSGYTGYPGYKPLPGALGEYNGKFMSSQVILRGGSCVTPASHNRASYRNFFPPSTRWQFSGLRLASNVSGDAHGSTTPGRRTQER
jgi:ergothioneine biosynthesis protein EgtB